MDTYNIIISLIIVWLFIGLLIALIRLSQLRKHKPEGQVSQSDQISLLPLLISGTLFWPKLLSVVYIDYKNLRYPIKHAIAEMELAYGLIEHAHQHMESGNANEVGACLFGYATASGCIKDDLKALIHRELPKINGAAAYFPKESGQSDLDHWYDLCHRTMGLIKEVRVWVVEKRDYYQAYLRLLCASGAVEQMLEIPTPGVCRYCKEGRVSK